MKPITDLPGTIIKPVTDLPGTIIDGGKDISTGVMGNNPMSSLLSGDTMTILLIGGAGILVIMLLKWITCLLILIIKKIIN